VLLEIGRRIGIRRRSEDPDGATAGLGAVDGAIFGLMGLLLAFTFSAATSRLDKRRDLIVQEANDIGTAYLRLDVLPAERQPALRDLFRRYVDSRLAVYRALPNVEAAQAKLKESQQIQGEIWTQAVAATKNVEGNSIPATTLVLSSLNQMIDVTTTRTVAMQTHTPPIIFVLLAVMVLAAALLSGFGMAGGKVRSLLHMIAFPLLMTIIIYVIIDIEYPRIGFIRLERFDSLLVDVRESMK
ncbi:MAG TPA: hypothetical protein VEX68_28750, partial [Bryobacteraceae bacterium]|nr:hypothetical protein [Bryobacteraceae bacterium]